MHDQHNSCSVMIPALYIGYHAIKYGKQCFSTKFLHSLSDIQLLEVAVAT